MKSGQDIFSCSFTGGGGESKFRAAQFSNVRKMLRLGGWKRRLQGAAIQPTPAYFEGKEESREGGREG
jgi:hypothetical protein